MSSAKNSTSPGPTPPNIALGEEVKFTIQGNKMTILDDDQKQQKATVVKARCHPITIGPLVCTGSNPGLRLGSKK